MNDPSSYARDHIYSITDTEEDEPESEEGEIDPYPLEGKYVDEIDKLR